MSIEGHRKEPKIKDALEESKEEGEMDMTLRENFRRLEEADYDEDQSQSDWPLIKEESMSSSPKGH